MFIFKILPCALTTTRTLYGRVLLVAVVAFPWKVNKYLADALGELFRSSENDWTLGRFPRSSGKRLYTSRQILATNLSFISLDIGS